MRIEDNKLIIENELTDDMIDTILENINKVETIQIDTDAISSLAFQQILCFHNKKEIICNNTFLSKFFENII